MNKTLRLSLLSLMFLMVATSFAIAETVEYTLDYAYCEHDGADDASDGVCTTDVSDNDANTYTLDHLEYIDARWDNGSTIDISETGTILDATVYIRAKKAPNMSAFAEVQDSSGTNLVVKQEWTTDSFETKAFSSNDLVNEVQSLLGSDQELRIYITDSSPDLDNLEIDYITLEIEFDDDAPEINSVVQEPEYPTCTDTVEVCVNVTDENDIDSVTIYWESLEAPLSLVTKGMVHQGGDIYCADVSPASLNAEDNRTVDFWITAEDEFENAGSTDSSSYTYDCLAPFADFSCNVTSGDEPLDVQCTDASTDTVDDSLDLLWSTTETTSVIDVHYDQNGTYTITLMVTDDAGHSNSTSQQITVNDLGPNASFDIGSNPADEGVIVSFTDTSVSHDDLMSWFWDFGDGENSTSEDPSHAYADNGNYTVSLTVCDVDNDCDSANEVLEVLNVDPTASFDNEPYSCLENETIVISATGDDVPADTLSYNWSTGDTTQSIMYTCGNGDDTETVYVTVTDDDSGSVTDSTDVTVHNVPPTANAGGPYHTAVGEEVCFYGSAEDVYDTSFFYHWDFDYDGSFDYDETGYDNNTACTTYTESGEVTIGLIVNDTDDLSNVSVATVFVHEYSIDLDEAWNLFSIPLVPTDDNTSIDFVLGADIPEKAEILWEYKWDEDEQKNVWSYNTPLQDNSRWSHANGRVMDIIPGYGYYIKMENATILYGDGEKFYNHGGPGSMPPQVELTTGWNLIGHYGMNNVFKSEERNDLAGASSFFQTHLAHMTLLEENSNPVYTLVPGEGYWTFITSSDNVLYGPSNADYEEYV